MDDYILNKNLAKSLNIDLDYYILLDGFEVYQAGNVDIAVRYGEFIDIFPDYCNNWNDLIPLLIKYAVPFQIDKDATSRQGANALFFALKKGQKNES